MDVTIPSSVTSIGYNAFNNCFNLTRLSIPNSVVEIGSNPFIHCKRLEEIVVSSDHPNLVVIDRVLFDKNDQRLISYPYAFASTEYAIPQGTRIIGDEAFWDCDISTVSIPDSVTSIGNDAFSSCDKLTSIEIPNSVTSIGNNAFSSCLHLSIIAIT